MTPDQADIVKDTLIYGAVGTLISIPIMLWLVPMEREKEWPGWTVPVVLTVIGLGVKLAVHHYLEGHGGELAAENA